MADAPRDRSASLGLLPLPERTAVTATLRTETAGGLVLLAAALITPVWANTPWSDVHEHIRPLRFGTPSPRPDLPLQQWTADGPLTLAVVGGLGTVPIIAISSTGDLHLAALAGAFAGLPALSLLQGYRVTGWRWNDRHRGVRPTRGRGTFKPSDPGWETWRVSRRRACPNPPEPTASRAGPVCVRKGCEPEHPTTAGALVHRLCSAPVKRPGRLRAAPGRIGSGLIA